MKDGHSPLIIGGHALWRHGWTTQIHQLIDVAVPEEARAVAPSGHRLHQRSAASISVLLRGAEHCREGWIVAPEKALADMIMQEGRGGLWRPTADELDEDALEGRREQVEAALQEMGSAGLAIPADILAVLSQGEANPEP